MRGNDEQQNDVFSYLSPEQRVRADHPLRAIRVMVDEVLRQLSRRFDAMYASVGRPSIAPEKLLRAQLLRRGISPLAHSDQSPSRGLNAYCRILLAHRSSLKGRTKSACSTLTVTHFPRSPNK